MKTKRQRKLMDDAMKSYTANNSWPGFTPKESTPRGKPSIAGYRNNPFYVNRD